MTEKKSAKKYAAPSEFVSLFNILLFFVFRRCGCAEVVNSDLMKNARQKLGQQAIADFYIPVG